MYPFLAVIQLIAMCTSFVTLALTSTKVFYSQRIGQFSEVDPSIRMNLLALPLIILTIAGPLYSIILIASYFRGSLKNRPNSSFFKTSSQRQIVKGRH